MSILPASPPQLRAVSVRPEEHRFVVELSDGRAMSIPYVYSARLAAATPEQRANFEITGRGRGIYWPDIDEDLSVAGLLRG